MAKRILARMIDIEAVMRMFNERHTHAARREMRNDLLNERGLARARPAREAEYFFTHDLLVFEIRFSLFNERAHAFFLIFKRKGAVKFATLELQPLRERGFERGVDCFLHLHHRG